MNVSNAGDGIDRIRVLCVDDERAVVEMTTELLEREGPIEAVAETAPATALERVGRDQFDCVVSDYDMPGMDGLELLSAVRERDEQIPFVLFTGKGSEEIASEAISAGVTEYLQKGAGTDKYAVLANRIQQAVERRRTERRLAVERERRDSLFREHPDPVVETTLPDDEPVIRETNAAFEEAFGPATPGERLSSVIQPPEDDPGVRPAVLNERAAAEQTVQATVRRKTPDGVRDFLVTIIPLSPPVGPERAYAVYTDITERERRERRIDALAREAQALLRAESREQAAQAAAEIVTEQFSVEMTGVYREMDGELRPLAVADTGVASVEQLPAYRRDSDCSVGRLLWRCFDSGEQARITEPAGGDAGFGKGVVWPLGDHGVLVAASKRETAVDETAGSLVEIVAANLTTVFDRIDREGVVTTLQGAARKIGDCEAVQTVCEQTVAAAEEILELRVSAVILNEEEGLIARAVSPEFEHVRDRRLSLEGSLAGQTFKQEERLVVDDLHAHPVADPENEQFRSALSLPIGRHGVFQAVREEFDAFTHRDADRVELLVAHTARTLDRIRAGPDVRQSGGAGAFDTPDD